MRVRGQDKKSFGDQGILSFEQTIKRDEAEDERETEDGVPRLASPNNPIVSSDLAKSAGKIQKTVRGYLVLVSVALAELRLANQYRQTVRP